jgi:hypothetical protein
VVSDRMRNLHARWRKRRHSDRSYRTMSWRHFYLRRRRMAGKSVYNFLQDFGKRNIVYMSILWNFHRKNWRDIENFALMHKILPA